MNKQATGSSRSYGLMLFGLIFFLPAFFLFSYQVLPSIYDSMRMQSWHSTQAQVLSGGVKTNRSSDSTTYEAFARYRFQVDYQTYTNDRIALTGGADNIGSFQQDLGRRIKSALQNHQTITIWYNPDDPADSIIARDIRWGQMALLMIMVVLFGCVGGGMMWFGWSHKADIPLEQLGDEPWLHNKDWQHNKIRSKAKSSFKFTLFFAIFWNLVCFPALFFFSEAHQDQGAVAYLLLLFPLVGLVLMIWAINAYRQWRRFGVTPLVMDPFPGAIAGDVGGSIKIAMPYHAKLAFKVSLNCIHRYQSGSGKNRSTKERLIWQQDGYAQVTRRAHRIILNFRFTVPSGLPVSEPKSSNYHAWRLTVVSKLAGVDFDRNFDIPVYATGQTSASDRAYSSDYRPSSVTKLSLATILPVVSGSQGREIYYGYFRNFGTCLMGFIFGSIFAGAGAFMWQEAATDGGMLYFMAVIFSLVGWLIALASLFSMLSSLRIHFDGKVLSSQKKLLGMLISNKQIPYQRLQSVEIKAGMHTQTGNKHTYKYQILAISSKDKITLCQDITSNQELVFLQKYFENEFFSRGAKLVFD